MRITKKLLSMILAATLVLGLLPSFAFATGEDVVYISVSYDDKFTEDKNGNPIAFVPVSFDALAGIDLNDYNLSEYLYDEDGDGKPEITALQLIIYAHEELYGGDFSEVSFTGSPGSSYFAGGLFGRDENLNYYLNGQYPLASGGWGATSDQIVLKAGDFLNLAGFTSWDFFQDSGYGFHFFANENGEIVRSYTIEDGTALDVKLIKGSKDFAYNSVFFDVPDYTVHYGTALYEETGTVTTDSNACASIIFPTAGTWYLWADGGYGTEYPDSIVSAPAYAAVTVIENVGCREHTVEIDQAVAATCTESGLTEGKHCSVCGEVLTEQEVIPATGHSYGNWTVTQAPTFTQEGQQEKSCQHCGKTVTEVLPVAVGQVEKWNIVLTDALNVNFYLNISQSVESTATVKIAVADTVITHAAKDLAKTDEGLYVASVELAAAQMTDDIVIYVMNDHEIGGYANYTIRQYADAVLADESFSKYHTLVKEMLNYGAAAQAYFDYCTDAPADEGITGTGTAQIPQDADQELTVSGAAEGVTFYAAALSYRDRIAVRYYFRFRGDINEVSFAANGTACTPGLKNGLYYVEVSDVLPENLDQQIELTVTDASSNQLTVNYGPMNYIVRMNEKGSESLQELLKALYNYHLAAKEVASLG